MNRTGTPHDLALPLPDSGLVGQLDLLGAQPEPGQTWRHKANNMTCTIIETRLRRFQWVRAMAPTWVGWPSFAWVDCEQEFRLDRFLAEWEPV